MGGLVNFSFLIILLPYNYTNKIKMSGQLSLMSESPVAYIIRRKVSQQITLIRDHVYLLKYWLYGRLPFLEYYI